MSANSKIEWTHHTFNPWWGCEKVSPACAFCYAERDANRFAPGLWGKDAQRRFFGDKHWNEPLKWNKAAEASGERHRVFCASMADVFEDRRDLMPHRARLLKLIEATPHLDWLLLTKRPENVARHVGQAITLEQMRTDDALRAADAWLFQHRNVWLGVTAEDQAHFDQRWPIISQLYPSVIFISAEPLLGPIQLPEDFLLPDFPEDDPRFVRRWMIVGGESGPHARAMHPDWARRLRDDCELEDIPFFFKQWGEWMPLPEPFRYSPRIGSGNREYNIALNHFARKHGASVLVDDRPEGWHQSMFTQGTCIFDGEVAIGRVGKKAAGRLLDGREWNDFPRVPA